MPDDRGSVGEHEHAWARARLPLYATGLLLEDETARVASHVASCEECAQYVHELRAGIDVRDDSPNHVPDGVLARWEVARGELRGFERAMVREHLASCRECAGALRMMGHEPLLAEVPELELAPDRRPDTRPASETGTRPGPELATGKTDHPAAEKFGIGGRGALHRKAARRSWIPAWPRLAIGGWAIVATAASLVLLLRPQSKVTSPPSLDSIQVIPLGVGRSGGDAQDVLTLPAGAEAFGFQVRCPAALETFPGGATVTVQGPDRQQISNRQVPLVDLCATVQVLRTPGRLVQPGNYRVTVTPTAATGVEPFELRFTIVSK